MKNYTFNFEIQTLLEQFVAAFNDVIIKRYDSHNTQVQPASGFKVNYIFGSKQRVIANLTTTGPNGIALPAVSVNIASISRDPSRVANKLQGFQIKNGDSQKENLLRKIPQPVPINIAVNMTIMVKYQSDMDQIISNFVPYCDPYIVISWKMPTTEDGNVPYEIRTEVDWSGNINLTYPGDLGGTQNFRISADTSFVIKGWLFKKMDETVGKIYVIDSDYNAVSNTNERLLTNIDDLTTKYYSISARPQPKSIFPIAAYFTTNPFLSAHDFRLDVFGKSFLNVRNVYLSASDVGMFDNISSFAPFSAYPKLSAKYPHFNGLIVPEFTLSNDNHISFVLPQIPKTIGYFDIIIENEAGYGKVISLNEDINDVLFQSELGDIITDEQSNPFGDSVFINSPSFVGFTVF